MVARRKKVRFLEKQTADSALHAAYKGGVAFHFPPHYKVAPALCRATEKTP
jgi:hypothetical protein